VDAGLQQRIRDFYTAYARGDMDAALEGFHADATLTNPEYAIDGGVRRGREQLRAALQGLHEGFEFQGIEVDELHEGPDGVLVLFPLVLRGRGSGAPIEERFAHVLRLRDGRVADLAWFRTAAEGRRAAGLT
jgi:ketosteroid isomerase-like protein